MAEWRSSSVSPGVRCRSDGGQLLVPAVQLHDDLEHRAHVQVEIILYALYQIRRFIIVLVTFHSLSARELACLMLGDLTNDNRFRMRSSSVLLTALVAEALVALQPHSPGDEKDYESVPYETVKEYEGYEERKYPSAKFNCTELTYNMYE